MVRCEGRFVAGREGFGAGCDGQEIDSYPNCIGGGVCKHFIFFTNAYDGKSDDGCNYCAMHLVIDRGARCDASQTASYQTAGPGKEAEFWVTVAPHEVPLRRDSLGTLSGLCRLAAGRESH